MLPLIILIEALFGLFHCIFFSDHLGRSRSRSKRRRIWIPSRTYPVGEGLWKYPLKARKGFLRYKFSLKLSFLFCALYAFTFVHEITHVLPVILAFPCLVVSASPFIVCRTSTNEKRFYQP